MKLDGADEVGIDFVGKLFEKALRTGPLITLNRNPLVDAFGFAIYMFEDAVAGECAVLYQSEDLLLIDVVPPEGWV